MSKRKTAQNKMDAVEAVVNLPRDPDVISDGIERKLWKLSGFCELVITFERWPDGPDQEGRTKKQAIAVPLEMLISPQGPENVKSMVTQSLGLLNNALVQAEIERLKAEQEAIRQQMLDNEEAVRLDDENYLNILGASARQNLGQEPVGPLKGATDAASQE